jgi:hypothetical protein
MNSAMIAAIQKKKAGTAKEGDHQDMGHPSEHADDKTKDLHSFVASLSEGDKHQLKGILAKDGSAGKNEMAIAKGGASTEEQGKIADAMAKGNKESDLEEQDEKDSGMMSSSDSDDIAKSLLDSRSMGANPITQPRNLSERVKMSLASKLKNKGKI